MFTAPYPVPMAQEDNNTAAVEPARRRGKILISAFACSPVRGSESAVGWNVATRLGQTHDVVLLFGENDHGYRFREEIERYLAEHGPIPGVSFVPVAHTKFSRVCQRIHDAGIWAVYYLGYRSWQRQAFHVAKRLTAAEGFDLVHQLNMIGYREPGYLWRLNVPFVWGPIGGASNLPWAYFGKMSGRGRLFYGARNLLNEAQKRLRGRPRSAARRAAKCWVVDPASQAMLQSWGCESETLLEAGTELSLPARLRKRAPGVPLRICWSGEQVDRKCLPILLDAIAGLAVESRPHLSVLGQGHETFRWKARAGELGLTSIDWIGRVPRSEALEVMGACDVLVLTSLQEATSLVVVESLSMAMPVVCHDACGMAIAVTPKCGIKVPMVDYASSVAGFRTAIERLSESAGLLETLSEGALNRSRELTWEKMAARISAEYDELIARARP